MASDIDQRLMLSTADGAALDTRAVLGAHYEARYALAALLREWEDNEVARHALERTLLAIVRTELERGNPDEAESAARELLHPDPDFDEAIDRQDDD